MVTGVDQGLQTPAPQGAISPPSYSQVTGHGEVQPLKMSKFSVTLRCVREGMEESLVVEYELGTGDCWFSFIVRT